MFNALFKVCSDLTHFKGVLSAVESVLALVSTDYVKDKNAKNAAIDALIEILQAHKEPQA